MTLKLNLNGYMQVLAIRPHNATLTVKVRCEEGNDRLLNAVRRWNARWTGAGAILQRNPF